MSPKEYVVEGLPSKTPCERLGNDGELGQLMSACPSGSSVQVAMKIDNM